MKEENRLLVEYKRTGDLQLLGDLYAPFMPLVYGLCLKYFKDTFKSEDAVMSIFEEMVTKLRIHQVQNFKPWLYTLAKNHCLMQLRKEKNMQTISIDDIDQKTDSFTFDQLLEDNLQLMESCLDTLSEDQMLCIKMFFLDKKCYADIAEETGYTWNQVKSAIQNGKRNLKLCMEKMGYEQS